LLPVTDEIDLPNAAGVLPNHRLSLLAAKSLLKLRHIRDDSVDASLRWRVGIRLG
jgi:hypothetical protein